MALDTLLVDLHMHTRCSDGVWDVPRLLDEVRERKLDAFCISDHDCLDAYPMPEDLRGRSIPGLEVDSHHQGHSAHILAYGVDDPHSPLLEALTAQRAARLERMHAMIEAIAARGIECSIDDVMAQASGSGGLGRPHLARALVARGAVANVQEAFDRYLADDGAAYVALDRHSAARIIELIHVSGGVAVVAHPMRLREATGLSELLDLGADGIEIIHPTADHAAQTQLAELARQRGLLSTGGTDFHAPMPDRRIGVQFSRAEVERLLESIAARRLAQ